MSPLILPACAGEKNTKGLKYQLVFRVVCSGLETAGSLFLSRGCWWVLETSHVFIAEAEGKLFRELHLHLHHIRVCAWLLSFYGLNICPTITFIESHNSRADPPVTPVSYQVG